MSEMFKTVLQMSLQGSYVILLVLAARLALRRAPKGLSYALWSVALFRLLCPVTLQSVFSLLPRGQVLAAPVERLAAAPGFITPTTVAPQTAGRGYIGLSANYIDPMAVCALIWLVGAAALLPLRWQQQARQLPPRQMARAEELRLRAGGPMTVLLPEGEITPGQGGQSPTVTQTDLEQLCDAVTDYSRYAAGETLSRGYLTARGGFRVGVCGTAVLREGVNTNLRDISSVTVRIGREQPGLGDEVLSQLFREGQFRSTVLLSPPGLGKTTLLRDLIRGLSDGVGGLPEHRVSVVDERGEIAVMYQGVPQMTVGRHTDVLDACPKAVGIPILLRAANPQVIAVDEITVREDIAAMAAAAHCGVRFLATIHADGRQELGRKPLFSQLLKAKVFEKAVTIRREGEQRQYIVEELW